MLLERAVEFFKWISVVNVRDFGFCTVIRESAADMILSRHSL